MRVAVLSDIHSNHLALKTCLDHAQTQGVDAYLFLGDYVGELAYPQKTMELLHSFTAQHDCRFIRGNREAYWNDYEARGKTGWKEFDTTTGCLYYGYHHLTQKDLAFFRTLPHTTDVRFPDLPTLTLCHGSPRKINEQLWPDAENTNEVLSSLQCNYLLCGHTHEQYKAQYGSKTLLNPGSVGMTHSSGKAQYMLLDEADHKWHETFVSLAYDVEAVIAELHESGLFERAPWWCLTTAHMLRGGSWNHGHVLNKAMQLCREDTGVCNFPEVPEKYWEQAAKELGLV